MKRLTENFRRSLIGAAVLALALSAPAARAATEPFKLVFIAYENPNQLVEDVEPVIAYLERALGRPVKSFVATDYAAVVEALRSGSADAGFMGVLQYLLARRHAGATALLGEVYGGADTYRSRIFVRKDSGLRELADLEGKTIAFVDPISSSGYLYPLVIFKDAKLISGRGEAETFFRRTYFAGGDEQAMRAVLNGFVDAAGVGQFAFDLLRGDERDQVTWIGESRPIPSHCVVVRKGLDPALRDRFQQALLTLDDGPDRALLKNLYGVDGYVEVDADTYAEAERLALEEGFLEGPPAGGRR